jgi:DNA-binding HxlR family transcriptional regulator
MRESVARIIRKTDHWPLAKRREYLIAALEREKGRWRRKQIAAALCGITTRVLKQELRHERA